MAHRHYGLRATKPPANKPASSGACSGTAFIAGIVVIMVVLGVVLYGISKTVTEVANRSTSAPRTTGQGAATTR